MLCRVTSKTGREGIEPSYWAPKAHVLPLDDLPILDATTLNVSKKSGGLSQVVKPPLAVTPQIIYFYSGNVNHDCKGQPKIGKRPDFRKHRDIRPENKVDHLKHQQYPQNDHDDERQHDDRKNGLKNLAKPHTRLQLTIINVPQRRSLSRSPYIKP